MTSQLIQNAADSTTDRTDSERFPYEGDHAGYALPTATARGVLRPTDTSEAIGAAGSLDCPACDSETTNGAGLFACTDCSWEGTLR
ncbi:hypothetical protein [Natronorubrum bangense]|uniref:Small CPxCG-related zinc finger protein n=2 Tax=Natronorubrum bangense TaxID=61858 RepID=L9W651_9EURY|nr:hypothetical protein [Natronorubrum bangense]ELY44934.1 hypothetical protein C494_16763 [Natronorubrum bangense JCM 10635]QCC54977.1 hypothetical protein DV706_11170 [Natronorubrum bangense]